MANDPINLGLVSFGDVGVDRFGRDLSHAHVIRDVVEEIVLADQVGVDAFGVGEHHRSDFAISSPEVVLAAAAARTGRIRLSSAATVLGADDPIRVFQRFSTLNAVSGGRAEVMLGRGWFPEAFTLFGHAISQYELLFSEKIDLFARILRSPVVSWQGTVRPPLENQRIFPTLDTDALRAWLAVGGTNAESVIRAAQYDLPLMLACLSGPPDRYEPLIHLYRQAFEKLQRPVQPVGIHSIGYIAETDEIAQSTFWPAYQRMRDWIGAGRGLPPITMQQYRNEIDFGSLFVGSPRSVAEKISGLHKRFGIARFDLKYSISGIDHADLMACIKLYGTAVIPRVKETMKVDRSKSNIRK